MIPQLYVYNTASYDAASIQASAASTKTYYVSPNGNDSNPGTIDKPWKTINRSVSASSPIKAGDTVLVQPGTYRELIDLGKSGNSSAGYITLKANGRVTLVDPNATQGDFGEGVIHASGKGYWVIDGFRIENTSWAGITLQDTHNMIVKNNHTYQTGASGIIAMPANYFGGGEKEVSSSNIKVLNNTIERANWRWTGGNDQNGTQEALSIWGVNGFEVAGNKLIQGKREGIDAKVGSRNGSIHNNNVSGQALVSGTAQGYRSGPGIYLDGNRAAMFNIDVYNNIVHNNVSDGIVVADEVPSQGDVSNVRIYNNVIYNNGRKGVNSGIGIFVNSNVRDVEIINNTLSRNVQSFYLSSDGEGARVRNVLVRNNIFAENSLGDGYVSNVDNLTLDHNLFTSGGQSFYKSGTPNNLIATNNKTVSSIGFANPSANNFRLKTGSPAINTGSSKIGQYSRKDITGKSRVQDGKPDIGAYEF